MPLVWSTLALETQSAAPKFKAALQPHVKKVKIHVQLHICCSSHIHVAICPFQKATIGDQRGTVLPLILPGNPLASLSLYDDVVSLGSKARPAPREDSHTSLAKKGSIGPSKITDTRLNLSTVHINQSGICRHTVRDTGGVYLGVIHG